MSEQAWQDIRKLAADWRGMSGIRHDPADCPDHGHCCDARSWTLEICADELEKLLPLPPPSGEANSK